MITGLVCNDRNNAMENWRKDDLMNERSPFTVFFPRCLITAQIINSMPLSIDSRCHTLRRRPLPHKDTQPRSIFRLLQCCRSEVDRLSNVPANSHQSGPTSLFRQHVLSLQRASMQLFSRSTCSWQSREWKHFGEKFGVSGARSDRDKDFWLFTLHNSAPMWTKSRKRTDVYSRDALKIREKERKHRLS